MYNKECKSLAVSEYNEDVDNDEDEEDDIDEEDSCFGLHEYEHVDNLETIQTSDNDDGIILMVKQLWNCLNCNHDKVIMKLKER